MKKILLVDVDSKIPNIALGKLSTYHKGKGSKIDYLKLGLKGFSRNVRCRVVDASGYTSVFASNIFTNNQKKFRIINCDSVFVGGVGSINSMVRLPDYIDAADVDYTLWPENDKSYGFITRGCIRKCKFCFVPKIEGKIYLDRNIDDIVRHKVTIFLDNNILAFPEHKSILQELVDKKIRCQFKQGLDIRLIDNENAELLSKIPYEAKYIFAFDDIRLEKLTERGTKIFQKYVPKIWRMSMFIYYTVEDPLADLVYRCHWCIQRGIKPYIMRNKNWSSSLYRDFLIDFTGFYGSTGGQWASVSEYRTRFISYLHKEKKNNKERMKESIDVYNRALKGEI